MGSHPTPEEGMIEMTVCFRARNCFKKGSKCGCEKKKNIYVRNCLNYYIYFLVPTGSAERYCTATTAVKKLKRKFFSLILDCNGRYTFVHYCFLCHCI